MGSAIKPIRFFLAISHYECLCILGMLDLYRSYTKHHLHGRSHSIEYDHPVFRFGTPLSAVQFYIGIGEACGFLWTLESAAEVEFGEIQDAFFIFIITLYFYPVRRCSGFSPSLLGKFNILFIGMRVFAFFAFWKICASPLNQLLFFSKLATLFQEIRACSYF